jgi:hypothetical protein
VQSTSDLKDADGNYLKDCVICQQRLDDPIHAFYQFIADPTHELYRYCGYMHWDCFARWENREPFARQYFQHERWIASRCKNAIAYADESLFVVVTPGKWHQFAVVHLAETASRFSVNLEDWEEWLDHRWIDRCHHDLEREALGDVLPTMRLVCPTPRDLYISAGIDPDQQWPDDPHEPSNHWKYLLASMSLAIRAQHNGIACPLCGMVSTDYTFTAVKMEQLESLPYLTCPHCDGNFGPRERHFEP